jgi:hypothetical protein
MFTTRFALLTLVTAAVVSVALVLLLDATPVIAVFSGLAAGALAAILPVAVGDGRFPGTHSGRRAVASFLVLGSALAVPPTLGLTRGAQLSLSILILVVGSAAFFLGSAAVIEEIET